MQVCVAVHGALTQPLESVTFAVSVQVPGAEQVWLRVTELATPVIVSLMQPLNTTVYGPVPLVMLTVKEVASPTQLVAAAGVMLQLGGGLTTNVAEQVVVQPNVSVTVKV